MSNLEQSRIGQIAIVCRDVARATAFYRDTLGLRHLFDAGPNLSFFDCGGVRLMLSTAEGREHEHASSILYFFISGIEDTHRELSAKGVQFVDAPHLIARMPDHELWLAAFTDSEGNTMAIMEEKR
ncbi:MAG TPA: VOC family protein [Gemmatimonadaceae bacterium]|nr:VOC family protein [Gemmatimonadaceae bacterium]